MSGADATIRRSGAPCGGSIHEKKVSMETIDEGQETITVVDHRLPPFIEMSTGAARYTADAIDAFAEANLMDVRDGTTEGEEAELVAAESEEAMSLARYLRSWANAWDRAEASS